MMQQREAYIMELDKALLYAPRCHIISWLIQKHDIRNMESQLFKWENEDSYKSSLSNPNYMPCGIPYGLFLILRISCFFNNHEMMQQRGAHIMELGKALMYAPRCCTISWLFQKHGTSNMES